MNLIPSVSEYDLYLFVFHPEQLGDEKREYIAGNSKFEESISHFRELAMSASEDISDSDKNLILSKIGVYMPNDRIFFLYPLKSGSDIKKQPKLQYRAASVEVEESVTSKTFMDSTKNYLIKANITRHDTKIYIFSQSGEPLHNLTLRIHPGGSVHQMPDNLQPLVIQGKVEVEHISLEIGEKK